MYKLTIFNCTSDNKDTTMQHLEILSRRCSVGVVLWDLDADGITADGLKEEGCHDPEHVDDEIQEDGLMWTWRRSGG